MHKTELKEFLDEKAELYERKSFIESDPIIIPHLFTKKEDIEIAAFMAASIAWGKRTMIIKNGERLMQMMDNQPHDFILNASPSDYKRFEPFVHRTFSGQTTIYFIKSLQNIYLNHNGLEAVFTKGYNKQQSIEGALAHFRNHFIFDPNTNPEQLRQVPNVEKNSACKRLNMFLRWMVREKRRGVDFGLWKQIPQSQLMVPLDLHSGGVSRKLGLLKRNQDDWKSVLELTQALREFDSEDPIKYDYALFGLGVFEKF